jgi:hypothetical protein
LVGKVIGLCPAVDQVEKSQSKSRHIVGTHIVLFFNQHGLYRANLKAVPIQIANKHTGKSISQNQVEKSQSKSRHIVGTHIVVEVILCFEVPVLWFPFLYFVLI